MAGVEIREGFLCPICLQDLGSVIQLQDHFELVHAGEDRAVVNQLKGHKLIILFLHVGAQLLIKFSSHLSTNT